MLPYPKLHSTQVSSCDMTVTLQIPIAEWQPVGRRARTGDRERLWCSWQGPTAKREAGDCSLRSGTNSHPSSGTPTTASRTHATGAATAARAAEAVCGEIAGTFRSSGHTTSQLLALTSSYGARVGSSFNAGVVFSRPQNQPLN